MRKWNIIILLWFRAFKQRTRHKKENIVWRSVYDVRKCWYCYAPPHRLALWCIGNPFESFRSNIIIPVDTFIVTVINDLRFKFHFFIVIMQASNKFHGIEISLLYNIIPFYRYLSSTTFGYIFFLIINSICWCNLQFHALTLHFVWVSRLSIKSVVRGTQRRLVVPLHPPPAPT